MSEASVKPDSSLCPICREDIDYFSFGYCNHPTCLKCALKLRKFGSADEPEFSKCATCRNRLNRIVVMSSFRQFEEIDLSILRLEVEFDFLFENQIIEDTFKGLLRCKCSKCPYVAVSMSALNRHTTIDHGLSYCNLCMQNARLLPCDFIAMTSSELAKHRKWNKKLWRGHPECEFCNQMFYEFEDLVKHIREAHFMCDFCHTVGINQVFKHQHELFQHYKTAHFVCLECDANNTTSCFQTVEQLGLHRLQEHPHESENDPNRWDLVKIQYANQHGRVQRGSNQPVNEELHLRGCRPEEWTGTDFPSLGTPVSEPANGTKPALQQDCSAGPDESSKRYLDKRSMASVLSSGKVLRVLEDDFPSLPSNDTIAVPTAHWPIKMSAHSNLAAGDVRKATTTRGSVRLAPTKADFPQLLTSSNQPLAFHQRADKTGIKKGLHRVSHLPPPTNQVYPRSRTYNGEYNFNPSTEASARWEPSTFNHIQSFDPVPSPAVESASGPGVASLSSDDFPSLSTKQPDTQLGNSWHRPPVAAPKTSQTKKRLTKATPTKSLDIEDTEIIIYEAFVYTSPRDYAALNRELIRSIGLELEKCPMKNAFSHFSDLSRRYRHDQLSALAYVQALEGFISSLQLSSAEPLAWLATMISLLPSVGKQRALLRALRGQGAPKVPGISTPNRAIPFSPPDWAANVVSLLQTCLTCNQVCLKASLKEHSAFAHR